MLAKCITASTLSNSPTTLTSLDTRGKIFTVTRNDGTRFRPCRLISSVNRGMVNDSSDLLNYATSTDPVYLMYNNTLEVYPTPTSTQNASVEHTSFPAVNMASSEIGNFPDEAQHLVVLYAAQKALLRLMNNKNASLSPLSITAVAPDIPTLSTTTVSFSESVPSYSPPNITAASGTQPLTKMEGISSGQIGTDADFIDFEMWFASLGEMIEDDEDIELASAQIEKINAYIQAYNIAMQNELNNFNESVAPYQAQLQISIQNAQLEDAADSKKLSKFQAEIGEYQAEVTSQVQEYTQNLQKDNMDYGWYAQQYAALKADYMLGIQMLASGGLPQQKERK